MIQTFLHKKNEKEKKTQTKNPDKIPGNDNSVENASKGQLLYGRMGRRAEWAESLNGSRGRGALPVSGLDR